MKLHLFSSLAVALLLIPTAVLADYRDDVGYRSLADDGYLISKGGNLKVGQVEAKVDGVYLPDYSRLDFLGKRFLNLNLNLPLPLPLGNTSGHATMVGAVFYGSSRGIAPNVRTISVWDTNSFLNGGLHVGQRAQNEPENLKVSVLNNSWVAAFPSDVHNIDAIRRLDWMIRRDDVVVVNGVDNGAGSPMSKLLATSYNGLAVGIEGGEGSSGGPINFDSHGTRAKPDIVVPIGTTSEAAGVVSGAAALLRSEAKARQVNLSQLTTKAMLLAGAERPEDWQRGATGSQDDLNVPLDYRYGAGSLRIDNSFDILLAGKQPNGGSDIGWDTALAKKKGKSYTFSTVDDEDDIDEHDSFTAVLTWNRDIKRGPRQSLKPSLSDLELSLLMKVGRRWRKVMRSDSDFDNLETITLADLRPGAYRLVVRGDKPEPYSLAWFKGNLDEGDDSGSGPDSLNSGSGSLNIDLGSGLLSIGEILPTVIPEPSLLMLLPAAAMLLRRKRM